jgi:intraflagellar transport protein 140
LRRYLAVVTDTGVIKLFDVSRKEPKPLGSSGQFVDQRTNKSLGVIRSIAVNADGTR